MLLHQKKIGALLRCFAREESLVEKTVTQVMASIDTILSTRVQDQQFIRQIEVLVPMDQSYGDCDCGSTATQLREALRARDLKEVTVSEVKHGDIFVGILNYGMARLLRSGCDYGVVLSKEAEAYCTSEAAEDLVQAAEAGALVTGIALNELTESIMQGRIANTFAMWNLMALIQVGGFDWRSAKPKKESPIVSRAQAWDTKKQFWQYDLAGVEEIVPMIRLVRTFGPCLAPILPRDSGKVWVAPDPTTDKEGYERHINKMGTKLVRQSHFADAEHTDLSYLMGGVMPSYQHPDYIK